ncbi:pilus assembly protein TadG-related protein [Rhodoferax sp.]|uniref:pilus assembly protein TadG-related protein n=1 Tax=Rhodoferax sp. TaxID=50421 RepID=UPI0025E4A7DC|nr:pilus assembly protein TadG-related protein [Rhodoferax sp.]MCM2295664.1 pilus assembly protein TadG-related protein [Rhodoferax sp.]
MKTVRLKAMRSRCQRGAVAITFAFSLLVLFGFMALVFDLGRTYVVRTELQNAADAAALAGAKDLNQKLSGVTTAIATVKAIGLQNNTKFSFNGNVGIVITDAMISVSSCPDDGCTWTQASVIASDAQAADKTFLKVYIPSGSLATFFARVPTTQGGTGIQETNTFGRAVAGFYVREITPIGICAIDLIKGGTRTSAAGTELTEFGFRRGVAYNIMELGPLGGSGQPYLLNPVDSWGSPACDPSHSSATYTAPFVCTGTSAAIGTVPGNVFGNTGISAGPIQAALNSRFKENACAPQDVNVKEYTVPKTAGTGPLGNPRDWTQEGADDYPSQQSITIDSSTRKPVPNPTIGQYGALWSYNWAVKAVGTSPNATAGTAFTLDDWPDLYAGNTADQTASGYPASSSFPGTLAAPYNTSIGSKYFALPPVTPGKRDRRVLNLAIVNCPASTGTGCNSTIPIVGIGRFFMQVEADLPKAIEAEFAGLIDPLPPPTEIRLYK